MTLYVLAKFTPSPAGLGKKIITPKSKTIKSTAVLTFLVNIPIATVAPTNAKYPALEYVKAKLIIKKTEIMGLTINDATAPKTINKLVKPGSKKVPTRR